MLAEQLVLRGIARLLPNSLVLAEEGGLTRPARRPAWTRKSTPSRRRRAVDRRSARRHDQLRAWHPALRVCRSPAGATAGRSPARSSTRWSARRSRSNERSATSAARPSTMGAPSSSSTRAAQATRSCRSARASDVCPRSSHDFAVHASSRRQVWRSRGPGWVAVAPTSSSVGSTPGTGRSAHRSSRLRAAS